MTKSLIGALFLALSLPSLSAPKPDLWPRWQAHAPDSTERVDHGAWDEFLARYIDSDPAPSRVKYRSVSKPDHAALKGYISTLSNTAVSTLNRREQMAYWINLYNAITVDLVLDHYPVKSITKIKSGFFSFGPWDKDVVVVEGEKLTLNDIEHRILRPIFDDPRIHYGVNCASIGCPELAEKAYTAENLETLLNAGAKSYVNSAGGVRIKGNKLFVSSIYEWFKVDFGGTDQAVIQHLAGYAEPSLKKQLDNVSRIADDFYDWSLNEPD